MQLLAFFYLMRRGLRMLWVHLRQPNRPWFWDMTLYPMRDAFWALFSSREDARALGSAWGHPIMFGLHAPASLMLADDEGDCYCVECLDWVPQPFFSDHNGRCWFCDHIETHASPKVLDYYHSLYQERY